MERSNKERQDNLQASVRVRGEEKKVSFSEYLETKQPLRTASIKLTVSHAGSDSVVHL